MNSIRIWIALAAVAVAASLQVVADSDFELVCSHVNAIFQDVDKVLDGQEVFRIAEEEISKSRLTGPARKALIEAWDNIYHGKDCSEKSWDYMADLNLCIGGKYFKPSFIAKPLEAYVKKCFKPVDVEQRLKSLYETSGVDFIDSEFIEKCVDDNQSRARGQICTNSQSSAGAVIDAIKRDLKREGKDPKEFFAKPTDMSQYLKEKLVKPCEHLKQSFEPLKHRIMLVGDYFVVGRKRGLDQLLSKEANELISRSDYCYYASNYRWAQIAIEAMEKLVRMLHDDEEKEIKEDLEWLRV